MRIQMNLNQSCRTMLALLVILAATNCASTSNAILPLPGNFEHRLGVSDVRVDTATGVNQTITSIAAAQLNRVEAVAATGVLEKDQPLTVERVQLLFSQRARKNLTFLGDNKVKLELVVTEMSLPVLGRASGLVGGDKSTMEVMLSLYNESDQLIGKYVYHAEYSPFAGSSRGFGRLDTILKVATVVSSAIKTDDQYIVAMMEDIINQILVQHGPR